MLGSPYAEVVDRLRRMKIRPNSEKRDKEVPGFSNVGMIIPGIFQRNVGVQVHQVDKCQEQIVMHNTNKGWYRKKYVTL